ncbi:hypothetical protein C3E96_003750 [Klebsiella pneumoniae]|nr:hypothetical protein C3E96_003750 [Klebsiella pneumoniae]
MALLLWLILNWELKRILTVLYGKHFLNKGAMLPNLPNGNGCSDFIIFPGEVYQIDIGCDKLLTIKDVLSWVFYCLTFWYVFTSLTSLLRKGGE